MLTIEYKYVGSHENLTFVNGDKVMIPCLFTPESVIPNYHFYTPAGVEYHINKQIALSLKMAVDADIVVHNIVVTYDNADNAYKSENWSITVLPEGYETRIEARKKTDLTNSA